MNENDRRRDFLTRCLSFFCNIQEIFSREMLQRKKFFL